MGTVQIPIGVRERFPVNFRVIVNVERINSEYCQ